MQKIVFSDSNKNWTQTAMLTNLPYRGFRHECTTPLSKSAKTLIVTKMADHAHCMSEGKIITNWANFVERKHLVTALVLVISDLKVNIYLFEHHAIYFNSWIL